MRAHELTDKLSGDGYRRFRSYDYYEIVGTEFKDNILHVYTVQYIDADDDGDPGETFNETFFYDPMKYDANIILKTILN